MEKYYEDDNFLYLVVEVIDLYFGFDLSTVRDYEIAAKIVTQSYSVDGINGKNVDAIIGGWKVSRVLPKWIKDSNCWIQFMNGYVAEKQDVDKNEEKEEEEGEEEDKIDDDDEEEEEEEEDEVEVKEEEEEEEEEKEVEGEEETSQVPKKNIKRKGSKASQSKKQIKKIKEEKKHLKSRRRMLFTQNRLLFLLRDQESREAKIMTQLLRMIQRWLYMLKRLTAALWNLP